MGIKKEKNKATLEVGYGNRLIAKFMGWKVEVGELGHHQDTIETLKNIIRTSRMSVRPEFYAGNGARTSDMNNETLWGIHAGIEKEFGKKAADSFVLMVADIEVLSATTFLQELYDLFASGWEFIAKETHALGVVVGKNKSGEYDIGSGMFGVASAMASDGRDETDEIRSWFLKRHGIKPTIEYCRDFTSIEHYGRWKRNPAIS